jgi:hypothetical protein
MMIRLLPALQQVDQAILIHGTMPGSQPGPGGCILTGRHGSQKRLRLIDRGGHNEPVSPSSSTISPLERSNAELRAIVRLAGEEIVKTKLWQMRYSSVGEVA